MNGPLPNYFLLLNMIFFVFLCLLTLCSCIVFSLFCMLSNKDNHNLKKDDEEQESKSKNALHTGQFYLNKRTTKRINITKKSCRAC